MESDLVKLQAFTMESVTEPGFVSMLWQSVLTFKVIKAKLIHQIDN